MASFMQEVQSAVIAHTDWKKRLTQTIATGASDVKVETVRLDNACPFGKWLYADAKAGFSSAADWDAVRALHAEFHVQAAAVLTLALAGKKAEAEKAMAFGSPYSAASSRFITAMARVRPAAA